MKPLIPTCVHCSQKVPLWYTSSQYVVETHMVWPIGLQFRQIGQLSLKASSHQMWNNTWNELLKGLFTPRLKQIFDKLITATFFLLKGEMYISIPHSLLFTFLFSLYVSFKHEICAVLLERQYQGNRKSLAVGIEMLHYSLLVDWLLNVPNTYFFCKNCNCKRPGSCGWSRHQLPLE